MNILMVTQTWTLGREVLRSLGAFGTAIHVLGPEEAQCLKFSRYCHSYYFCRSEELSHPDDSFIHKIHQICEAKKIDVIVPGDMTGSFFLSKVRDKITSAKIFPVADTELLERLNDKWGFAKFLKQHNLPFPETRLIESLDQIKFLGLHFPLIAKSLRSSRIRAVSLNTQKDLAALAAKEANEGELPFLVQEYIPGEDVDFSVLANRGEIVAWTIQKWLPERCLEFISDNQVLEVGRRMVAACQYIGIAHYDLRRDARDGSIKILECNPRAWGSLPASKVCGVDFMSLGILIALGKKTPPAHYQPTIVMRPLAFLKKMALLKLSRREITKPTLHRLWIFFSDPWIDFYWQFVSLREILKKQLRSFSILISPHYHRKSARDGIYIR